MSTSKPSRKRRTAATAEGRENQLISAALDLVEKQILNGTAAATVLTHFLKLASVREKLEQEKLHQENLLLSAKIEALASAKRIEELYEQALKAMKTYAGQEDLMGFDE